MSKKHDILWTECVNKAKHLVLTIEENKMAVADMAIKCIVLKGNDRNFYSVKKFADAIGVAKSTLHDWIKLRLMKLNSEVKMDKKTFSFLAKTYPMNKIVSGDFPTEKLSDEDMTIFMYARSLKSILFNIRNPLKVKNISQELKSEIVHLCREIIFILAKDDKKVVQHNVQEEFYR